MSENEKKKSKKIVWIILSLLVLAGVVVGALFFLGNREKAYRNIFVTEVTGKVTVNRGDIEDLKVSEGMNLQSGDEVLTGEGAKLTLRLDDDKYVVVDENSKLVLIAKGTKEDSKTALELEYGAVFSDIKNKLSENSEYEVVTPSSTMAVRGTQFEVVYRKKSEKDGTGAAMKILTFEGKVEVEPVGAKETRVVKAGTMEELVKASEGGYEFAGETRKIEAEDLSELSATYLKEDIEKSLEDLSGKEREQKEALLKKAEEYLEEILPEIKAKEDKEHSELPVITPTPGPSPTPGPTVTPHPLGTPTPVPGASYTGEVYDMGDHSYQFIPLEGRSWEEIVAYCEELGGYPASILNEEESKFLYEIMLKEEYYYAYFGYTDEVSEGNWVWESGEAAIYENWYAEDLDNYHEEDYAMLWQQRPGYWNDGGLREGDLAAFICEWGPKGPSQTSTEDITFEDGTFTMRVYLPKVLNDFGAIAVSDIEEFYEELEAYSYPYEGSIREKASLRERMTDRLRGVANNYIQGEGFIMDAAKEAFGTKVVITCDGFYDTYGNYYRMTDDFFFGELGIADGGYFDIYPAYTVHVVEEDLDYRYVPCRMMVETENDVEFYMMMMLSGVDITCPIVEGYIVDWMIGDTRAYSNVQQIYPDMMNWPILYIGEGE